MLNKITALYDQITGFLASKFGESLVLLFVRCALAFPFWSSARTKVEEGTLLTMNEIQPILFENEFGMPASLAPITMYAEHFLPILLVIGLFTRFAASGLFVMTMVIQFLVFPEAWGTVHMFWTALALILISRGGGVISLDALLTRNRP